MSGDPVPRQSRRYAEIHMTQKIFEASDLLGPFFEKKFDNGLWECVIILRLIRGTDIRANIKIPY